MHSLTKWDFAHMDVAVRYSELSSSKRLKVGCVIIKNHRIISIGYNGMPSGWSNVCEYEDENGQIKTKSDVFHAEENAITKLARFGESAENADLYVTHWPCIRCARLIYASGIKRLFYRYKYISDSEPDDSVSFLMAAKIQVINVP